MGSGAAILGILLVRDLSHSLQFGTTIALAGRDSACMATTATFDRLTKVLRDVFYNEELIATPDLTARAVQGWDSLGHVRLFVELERVFGLRFSATEISSLKNVGQLADLLERKIARSKS